MVLGRATDCEITLPSSHISRNHAHLYFVDGNVTIEDLDASNGTLVNGEGLAASGQLKDSDKIPIHDQLFRVSENYAWAGGEEYAWDQTTHIRPVHKP